MLTRLWQVDMWALGISVIEMAEVVPPRWTVHPMRVIFQISREAPPRLKDRDAWSPALHDFVAQCLQKARAMLAIFPSGAAHLCRTECGRDVDQCSTALPDSMSMQHVCNCWTSQCAGPVACHRRRCPSQPVQDPRQRPTANELATHRLCVGASLAAQAALLPMIAASRDALAAASLDGLCDGGGDAPAGKLGVPNGAVPRGIGDTGRFSWKAAPSGGTTGGCLFVSSALSILLFAALLFRMLAGSCRFCQAILFVHRANLQPATEIVESYENESVSSVRCWESPRHAG